MVQSEQWPPHCDVNCVRACEHLSMPRQTLCVPVCGVRGSIQFLQVGALVCCSPAITRHTRPPARIAWNQIGCTPYEPDRVCACQHVLSHACVGTRHPCCVPHVPCLNITPPTRSQSHTHARARTHTHTHTHTITRAHARMHVHTRAHTHTHTHTHTPRAGWASLATRPLPLRPPAGRSRTVASSRPRTCATGEPRTPWLVCWMNKQRNKGTPAPARLGWCVDRCVGCQCWASQLSYSTA